MNIFKNFLALYALKKMFKREKHEKPHLDQTEHFGNNADFFGDYNSPVNNCNSGRPFNLGDTSHGRWDNDFGHQWRDNSRYDEDDNNW